MQKSELKGKLYVALESTPKIPLLEKRKNAQRSEEKDSFYAAVDDPLDSAVKRFI